MTLLSLKEIVGCEDYYIDDETFQIYSFKQKKYEQGRLLKQYVDKDGYICFDFYVDGKVKRIFYHKIIVKMFIKPDYDSTKYNIDHMDHNRTNNSINNLCIVSRSENNRNSSKSRTGTEFNFVEDIGQSLIINEEAGIFYSLELDKFYMFISHTNKFKELHENMNRGRPYIRYSYNNKQYMFSTTKIRKNINNK